MQIEIAKMNKDEFIQFAHIPKCGGASFRKGLKEAYLDEVYIFNMNPIPFCNRGKFWRIYEKLKRKICKKHYYEIYEKYKIIYGHFCFDEIYAPPSSIVRRGAFFRDPIEWVGSYHLYMHQKHPRYIPVSTVKMIQNMGLQMGFKKYLGKHSVEDLDFVGITENYENSLKLFEKIFSKKIAYYQINQTKSSPNSYREKFQNEGLLSDIEALMAENLEIYDRALKRYDRLNSDYADT